MNRNTWTGPSIPVAESFVGKGRYIKKIRIHGRGRFGIQEKKYCHYFLVLKEGTGREKNIKRRLKHMSELEEIQRHPRHIVNSLAWWWRLFSRLLLGVLDPFQTPIFSWAEPNILGEKIGVWNNQERLFHLERLSRSFRLAWPGISTLERLWNGFVSCAEPNA